MPQDFSGQNLRGRSFKGQNLEGANFSGADIRSADFSNAILVGANFRHAKAGLQRRWAIFLVVVSWVLIGLSGFLSAFGGVLVTVFISNTEKNNPSTHQLGGWTIIVILVIFLFVTIRQGIQEGLRAGAAAVAVAVTGAGAAAVVGAIALTLAEVRGEDGAAAGAAAGVVATAFTFGIFGAGVGAGAVVGAFALAVALVLAEALTLTFLAFAFAFALAGAVVVALAVAKAGTVTAPGAFAGALVLFSIYISRRALKEDPKYALIRNIAVTFAAFKGTSFRNAVLTDADFTSSLLKSTDFRKANIIRTCWLNAEKLDRIRPGTTYLQNEQVRQLVINGKGKNKNFDRFDLRGLNIREGDLENASFIDADLYQANLQGANLSRTILVRTNFERADLRCTNLTGSCIQDWVITESTKLDGIICDYVYLKLVNGDKRDQMPPRGKFKEGGFVTFVRYILETVELYHEKDINPRLALTVLQKMSKDYDEPLNVVALGKRGDKVFIQVKVSENIIRENFKDDYYSRYDSILKLWSGNTHQLPPAVNNFIEKRINEIASERIDDFIFVDVAYVEGNYTEINQGDTTMTGDRNINIPSGNYNERIEGDYIQGDKVNSMTNNPGGFSVGGSVGGNVNNVQGDGNRAVQGDNNQAVLGDGNQVAQQNQVGADTSESLTKEDVVKLLAQLETLIKGAELPADTKEEVIEDLSAAKKATDKEEPNKQRALERLGTVAETLEKTSKGVEAGQKIWTTAKPIIIKVATWLGAAAGSHLLGL